MYAVGGQREQALDHINAAIKKKLVDSELVDIAVEQLDSIGQYDESLALLKSAAAAKAGDLAFRRKVVARLYQSGQYDAVIEQSVALDSDLEKADADLLGHRALALLALNRYSEADKIIQAMASRTSDFAAVGWGGVLAAIPRDSALPDDRRMIAACQEALKIRPQNPYFRLDLGDAYAHAGEIYAAADAWTEAAKLAPVWPAPQVRILQTLGQPDQVSESVNQAIDKCAQLANADAKSLASVVMIKSRLIHPTNPAELGDILTLIDRVQQLEPGEGSSLAVKVELLASAGRKPEADSVIQSVLKSPKKRAENTILAMAIASNAAKLGLEKACFDRCRADFGVTSRLGMTQAVCAIRGGKTADTIALFESLRHEAADHDDPLWQLTWAQLLDEAADPRALKEWQALADNRSNDLSVQQAALNARCAQQDRDLQRRCIDRLHAAVGEDGSVWRIADARWIMQGALLKATASEREQELVKAASILNDVTRRLPNVVQTHLLLGECMFRLNNKSEAMKELTEADRLDPTSLDVILQLVSLLQSTGDFASARPYMDRAEAMLQKSAVAARQPAIAQQDGFAERAKAQLALEQTSRNAAWRTLASLYAARGDTDHAVSILTNLASEPDVDLGLAELQSKMGTLTEDRCRELLSHPTPASIGIVADFYATSGNKAEAEKTIAMLDHVNGQAGEKELVRGVYFQRHGDHDEAVKQLSAACAAAPQNRTARKLLLMLLLGDGRADESIAVANNAHKALPDEEVFSTVANQAQLIRAVADASPSRPLLAALPMDAEHADVIVAALRLIQDGRTGNKTVAQVSAEMKPLADRAPSFLPLQDLLIEMDVRSGNFDDAELIAARTMQLAPADPAPAKRAAEVLALAGRWDQVLGVAKEWRSRLGSRTLPADLMLARAYLATGDYAAANQQLQPYVKRASADPAGWTELFPLYSQALIGQDHTADAQAFFEPALKVSAQLREAWILVAVRSIRDDGVAASWLQRVAAVIPADAVDEKITLSSAWSALAKRAGGTSYGQAAATLRKEVSSQLQSSGKATAKSWISLAVLCDGLDDDASAESAYRAALRLDPNNAVVQNNLAMVILHRGGDLNEALVLAKAAAGSTDEADRANFLDTQAQIEGKLGHREAAQAALQQAVQLQPKVPEFRANLAQALLKNGKVTESKKALDELESLIGQLPSPDPQIAQQIATMREQIKSAAPSN